jgi:hypothetical protein
LSWLAISIIVAGLIAGSGFVGLFLQKQLAEHHITERSRDMIGGVVGLLTLLFTLVLRLLIWTSYGRLPDFHCKSVTIAPLAPYAPKAKTASECGEVPLEAPNSRDIELL